MPWKCNNMRKIMLITLSAATYLLLMNIASGNESVQIQQELRDECSYDITGMRECLQKKVKSSEIELSQAEEKMQESLARWGEEKKYADLAKAKFVASKHTFTKYREEQCAFAASLGGSAIGNALDMGRFACIAELNNRRAEQLRYASTDLSLK